MRTLSRYLALERQTSAKVKRAPLVSGQRGSGCPQRASRALKPAWKRTVPSASTRSSASTTAS